MNKRLNIVFFGILFMYTHFHVIKPARSGVPIGILIDSDMYSDIKNVTEKTIAFLNNGIKYGRNKWLFRINMIKTTDSNEVIRACKFHLKYT